VKSGRTCTVTIEIGSNFRFDLEISLAKLSKKILGAGAPVKESKTPLFENSTWFKTVKPLLEGLGFTTTG
jgi:hypothetical protein